MPGLDPVLLAVYSEVEGRELVEVILPPHSFGFLQAVNSKLAGFAEGRGKSQSPCCPWLALQGSLCSAGAKSTGNSEILPGKQLGNSRKDPNDTWEAPSNNIPPMCHL